MMIRVCVSWSLLYVSILVAAQSPKFVRIGAEQGLSQNTILSIIQDKQGFLWIGTQDGLNRYDGYGFRIYHDDPTSGNRLSNDEIWSLLQDREGLLWMGHGQGVSLLDPLEDKIVNILTELDLTVISLYQDRAGMIWAGTAGQGLIRIHPNTHEVTRFKNVPDPVATFSGPAWTMVANYFLSIHEDHDGRLLVGTRGAGLYEFKDGTFQRINDNPILLQNDIWSILEDQQGRFYLGSTKGLVVFERNFKEGKVFAKAEGLSNIRISRLEFGKDDKLWIATYGGGLISFDLKTEKFRTYDHEDNNPNSISSSLCYTLLLDAHGNLWTGTWASGLNKLSHLAQRFQNYSSSNGLRSDYVTSVAGTGDSLLVGTYSGGLHYILLSDLHRGKPFQPIKAPLYISGMALGKRTIWLAVDGFGVGYIRRGEPVKEVKFYKRLENNPNSIENNIVRTVLEDTWDNLWVGTKGSGLKCIDLAKEYGSLGSVSDYTESGDNRVLEGKDIHLLHLDRKGFLWVGTDKGLSRSRSAYRGKEIPDQFIGVSKNPVEVLMEGSDSVLWAGTSNGLYRIENDSMVRIVELEDNYINSIVESQDGKLWIATNRGIYSMGKRGDKVTYNSDDGLMGNEFNVRSAWSTSKTIFMGGTHGLTVFDPADLQEEGEKATVGITSVKFVNENPELLDPKVRSRIDIIYKPQLQITVPHFVNILEFEFTSFDFTNPGKNTYRYKLEGFDKDWVNASHGRHSAVYTNLEGDNYSFSVQALDGKGQWSEPQKLVDLTVMPPPWKTWWAYIGYGLLVAGLLFVARRTIVQRERLKSNLKLERLELEKAKEVDRVKTSFFTNISHEFRTPLTLIKGPVQDLLEKFADNPEVEGRLRMVQRNSDLLLKLINQLLDLARLDSGSLKIEKSEGDLNSFINAVVSSFSSFAAQKSVTIGIDMPSTHYLAIFDKDKLETILINLINNAIKFTPAGGTVNVVAILSPLSFGEGLPAKEIAKASDKVTHLILSVADNGIGIPEDQQHKIFERFHQVSEAHKEVGTGIGLALVKELTVLLDGSIVVKSKPGEGSEFKVTLPIELRKVLQEFKEMPAPRAEVIADEYSVRKKTEVDLRAPVNPYILVVEDNTDLRRFIIDSLGHEFHFMEASDGKQGLDIATREVPDLIISDVMMPEMDGITMTGKIKKDIRTSHIPLILLTAKSTEDSKLCGLQTGADDYLTKPFNKNELLLKARNSIAIRSRMREKLRVELMSTAPKVEVLSSDEQFLLNVKEGILKRLSDEQLSVESLSEDIGLSRVQLYRKISALTGLSVNELIQSLRLQKAAQLLERNWGPVSQVASEVGFSNISYFSKVFKEEYGVLPSEFARRE